MLPFSFRADVVCKCTPLCEDRADVQRASKAVTNMVVLYGGAGARTVVHIMRHDHVLTRCDLLCQWPFSRS